MWTSWFQYLDDAAQVSRSSFSAPGLILPEMFRLSSMSGARTETLDIVGEGVWGKVAYCLGSKTLHATADYSLSQSTRAVSLSSHQHHKTYTLTHLTSGCSPTTKTTLSQPLRLWLAGKAIENLG